MREFVHRDELIVYPVVQHEEHAGFAGVILNSEEALTRIIRLLVVHKLGGDERFVGLSVGRETNPPVEEYLEVRPYLGDRLPPRLL